MSDDKRLERMRTLRRRAAAMNGTVVADHRPFLHTADKVTFFRRPDKPPSEGDEPNVTPTCTAFMTLALTGAWRELYKPEYPEQIPSVLREGFDEPQQKELVERGLSERDHQTICREAISRLLDTKWETAGLDPNNAFTTSLVLRANGMLFRAGLLTNQQLGALTRTHADPEPKNAEDPSNRRYRRLHSHRLKTIADLLVCNVPESLRVQEYPARPTIGYWLLDAVALLRVRWKASAARRVVDWAAREFARQVSLVSANDHVRMDPIAMAMAASVCRLLRRISRTDESIGKALASPSRESTVGVFPSFTELRSAINVFLGAQNRAGVWEKYFPLFHYPAAGANHCWHFEVLEAVLHEFPEIFRKQSTIDKLERSLDWLEANRLTWFGDGKEFVGWNSGSDIPTLETGQPESWPTGVVHMFLWRLRNALSEQIRELVLEKYPHRVQYINAADNKGWNDYLDCDLPGQQGERATVKGMLHVEVLRPVGEAVNSFLNRCEPCEKQQVGPNFRLDPRQRRSALLFGPPGTSKTSLAEAVAKKLGWHFLELSPSDFLKGGLDGIYDRVNEVFEDLMDLYGVVILFDEMDALVQSREDAGDEGKEGRGGSTQLDVTQKFLTTSMLPKLLQLRKQGQTVFFMATNHQKSFDPAIKRPGRFDLLLRMAPPTYDEKKRGLSLDHWYQAKEMIADREAVLRRFEECTTSRPIREALKRFTFGEMDAFFDMIRQKDEQNENLRIGMESTCVEDLEKMVMEWAKDRIVLRDGSRALADFEEDAKEIRRQ